MEDASTLSKMVHQRDDDGRLVGDPPRGVAIPSALRTRGAPSTLVEVQYCVAGLEVEGGRQEL